MGEEGICWARNEAIGTILLVPPFLAIPKRDTLLYPSGNYKTLEYMEQKEEKKLSNEFNF